MNDQFLRLSRRIALAVLCMLPAPLLAEAPLVPVSDHAGQVVRQDLVPGAYEIVHAPELGLVFVASSPALDDGSSCRIAPLRWRWITATAGSMSAIR
ncbi:hypothetical protein [Paracoccus denitrificans]|uniref:hypothetical protein n=1 Tax=Paracoccus denitrificans TaxID=266 RepID=UPI000CEBCF98|nr:hypothetical protein [Paracoccus denitrificans]